jgi:hypothetical protein
MDKNKTGDGFHPPDITKSHKFAIGNLNVTFRRNQPALSSSFRLTVQTISPQNEKAAIHQDYSSLSSVVAMQGFEPRTLRI